VTLLAGVVDRRQSRVVGRRHRLGVEAGDDLDELLGAVELRLHPAGDARLDVTFAAGHVAVGTGGVGDELGSHLVAASAEVGRLGPADEHRAREGHDREGPADDEDEREKPSS
jgi:hypothetical protein